MIAAIEKFVRIFATIVPAFFCRGEADLQEHESSLHEHHDHAGDDDPAAELKPDGVRQDAVAVRPPACPPKPSRVVRERSAARPLPRAAPSAPSSVSCVLLDWVRPSSSVMVDGRPPASLCPAVERSARRTSPRVIGAAALAVDNRGRRDLSGWTRPRRAARGYSHRVHTEEDHEQNQAAERDGRAMERQRWRARLAGPDRGRQPGLRRQRLQHRRPARAPAQARLQGAADVARQGRVARHRAGRLRRAGDEGLGAGEGRDALHALVPAADRHDGREARLLLRPDRRRQRDRRVLRQGAHPGRARRLLVPDRRHPRDVRGPRLHRVGPDLAGVHPGEPQRGAAVHPDGVRVMDRRGAGHEDPAAALDGRAVEVGDPRAGPARRPGRHARVHDRRPRAGVLPDRRAVLLRAPGPDHDGAHAVRRQAAQGPRARRALLRLDPRADPRVHDGDRARAREARRAGQDAPQRGRAEPVRARADLRELQRRAATTSS